MERDSEKTILIAGEREFSLQQLHLDGIRVAGGLQQAGLKPGNAVALILRNDFAYFSLHDAARYGPFDIVPVNWHLQAKEIAYILDDCAAKAVFIHEDLLTQDLESVLDDRFVVVIPTPIEVSTAYAISNDTSNFTQDYSIWEDWINNSPEADSEPLPFYLPLFYTSGSSGKPKAVKREDLPIEVAQKVGERTRFAWGFDKQPICSVMTGPLYHSAPNGYGNLVLQRGGKLVLQPRFDAEDLLVLIQKYSVTHLHMVPTMFNRLLALSDEIKNEYDLSSLIHVTHGAAPCPPEMKRNMINWWGNVIHEYYAMTETGIITCSSSEQWMTHPGTVGCAAPGVSLQIRDDDGNIMAANQPGVICVKHEATSYVSYHNAEAKTEELIQDEYLVTGDIGYLDEDGFLYISDRQSDMVISGGVNIYPAEIEAELVTMPGVKDCAVFGVSDKEFGEKLVAFIETDEPLNKEEMTAFLKQRLASFKIPRIYEFVESLSREDSGKIKKRQIKEQYLQG